MSERLHHLDALRALAMLLILPAHALALIALSNGGWTDVERTAYWLVHVFRLPLFFLVAGFFGALLLEARGTRRLLLNRLLRIGVPMLVVIVFVAPPLDLVVQSQMGIHLRPDGVGAFLDPHPSFAWFLWYLSIIYAASLLGRWLLGRLPAMRGFLLTSASRLLSHWASPVLLAIPCALALYWQPTWIAEAPSEGFLPRPDLLVYYGLFFVCGWAIFAGENGLRTIELHPRPYLILTALALPPALALYLLQRQPEIGNSRGLHVLALLLFSVVTWSLAFGLLGLTHRFLSGPNPRLRYWADASYWIYLSHLPVMAVLGVVIFAMPIPDSLRFALLVFATLGVVFLAYGAFVRHTVIGRVLHGPRLRAERSPSRLRSLAKPAAATEPPA